VRRLFCLFLLLLLPLHGLAVQGGLLSAQGVFDVAHELDHLNAKSHHHHDDGAVHYDDSGKSAAHFADHLSAQQPAAPPSADMPLLAIEPYTVRPFEPAYYLPDLVLERPQRPPSALR
jgi:hypothetical protein